LKLFSLFFSVPSLDCCDSSGGAQIISKSKELGKECKCLIFDYLAYFKGIFLRETKIPFSMIL